MHLIRYQADMETDSAVQTRASQETDVLAFVAQTIFEFLDVMPRAYAHETMQAFYKGDRRRWEEFFRSLWLKPTPENIYALWHILRRSGRWQQVAGQALSRYLHVAVRDKGDELRELWKRE